MDIKRRLGAVVCAAVTIATGVFATASPAAATTVVQATQAGGAAAVTNAPALATGLPVADIVLSPDKTDAAAMSVIVDARASTHDAYYDIDFGDGGWDGGDSGLATHTYDSAGTYTVTAYVYDSAWNFSVVSASVTVPFAKTLTVVKSGTGSGTVKNLASGIDCGNSCSAEFAGGESVLLTATPAPGSSFGGWGGACSGLASTCQVKMTLVREVSAVFIADPVVPPPVTTYQEHSKGVALSGWGTTMDAIASGGLFRSSKVIGDWASFEFSGDAVTWLTRKGPYQGVAKVFVDGVSRETLDLYATTPQTFSKRYTGLGAGTHTLTVKVTGRNGSSSAGYVVVDGFVVGQSLSQERAPKVVFGSWHGRNSKQASGGSFRLANTSASSTLTFTGTEVEWITSTRPQGGRARVFIDGVDQGVVDLYAPQRAWGVRKTYDGLSEGAHTITVQALGTSNRASSGTKVIVDAFKVHPS